MSQFESRRQRNSGGYCLFVADAALFFDTRDNDTFVEDDVGVELSDLEAVKAQAAVSLAELAREALPGSVKRELAVEDRDLRKPVLKSLLTFEAVLLVGGG